MRPLIVCLIAFVVCGGAPSHVASARDEVNPNLARIKRIYIGEFRGEDDTQIDLIREKIRARLLRSDRFVVVETPDRADAVLTGIAEFERDRQGSIAATRRGGITGGIRTEYFSLGVFRLVDSRTDETLWIYDYKPRLFRVEFRPNRPNNELNRIADRVSDRLLKDAKDGGRK